MVLLTVGRDAAVYGAFVVGVDRAAGDGAAGHEPLRGGRPRALLVDLDETLLDNTGVLESVARTCEVVAATVDGLDRLQLLRANTEIWRNYWPAVEPLCWRGRIGGFMVSREAWRRTLRACGCTDAGVLRDAFEIYQRFSRAAYRLFDDAVEFLARARTSQVRLALVTNGPADIQRDKLRVLELTDTFDAIVISGEVGLAKPDPELFELALDQLLVPADDAWHVGDSLAVDVQGAHTAGLFAVWLNRRGLRTTPHHPRPDLQISSLSEITPLLR